MAELMSEGYSKVAMCRVVGIAERTFFDWQRRARDGVEPYASLMWVVAKAEEELTHKVEQEVRHAENLRGGPDAAGRIAWLKARREEWTTKVRIETVQQQVISAVLDFTRTRIDPDIYDNHVAPVLLEMAGSPLPPPSTPLVIEADGSDLPTDVD
jgi:hypothetical protein